MAAGSISGPSGPADLDGLSRYVQAPNGAHNVPAKAVRVPAAVLQTPFGDTAAAEQLTTDDLTDRQLTN